MNKGVDILRRKPLVAIAFSILLLSICSYHYLARVDLDIRLLIILSFLTIFMSLINKAKFFFLGVVKEPKKYFLIICILVSAAVGLIINIANIIETSLFLGFFFLIYLIFINRDRDLINLASKLVVYSGVFMSFGVIAGLFESMFLSSKLFYHIADDYPSILDQKYIYSGFGFSHNYSAHIIVIALSFLFLSESNVSRKQRSYLILLFSLALLITSSRIVFLFFSLIACNYFFKERINKYLISALLIALYLLFTHILIGLHGNYELGSSHYRELLFSIGNIDFILGNYGYTKLAYFSELKENLFLPVDLTEITQSLASDPHSLIYSLIILGGLPLALSVVVFLALGIFNNLSFIEQNYSKFYYCGLISIIIETFVWDAGNSIFFWIIILHAMAISKDATNRQIIN